MKTKKRSIMTRSTKEKPIHKYVIVFNDGTELHFECDNIYQIEGGILQFDKDEVTQVAVSCQSFKYLRHDHSGAFVHDPNKPSQQERFIVDLTKHKPDQILEVKGTTQQTRKIDENETRC